jgi:lipopolysaccharide/colanic/teichoic acid biosynthesis glycosyltransferase
MSEATRRALVTPGLTGLWQISGRSDLKGEDAIRLDLRYVENWSLTLALVILWKTISAVLPDAGLSVSGSGTRPEPLASGRRRPSFLAAGAAW